MHLYEVLTAVLLAEAGILGAGLSFLFGHTALRRLRTARLRSGVRVSRHILARVLAGDADRPALPRLPMDKAIEAVADLTRSADDAGRARLAQLPVYVSLAQRSARWCTSARWSRRLKGVRLLAILGAGHTTVPPLLDDARSEVRSAAAAWASNHPSEQIVTRLVLMLSDESLACRLAAQNTLIRMGRYAVPAIMRHLTGAAPAALATVLLVASRVHDSALIGPALTHRKHSDPAVRSAVAQVVASVGGTAGIRELEDYLSDPAAGVRAAAAAGLGELGHWPSSPLLADRLGDSSWEARRAAALALDQLGSPGQLYLQRALLSTDRFAQDMAQQVLNRGVSVRSGPALPAGADSTMAGRVTE